jgi:hypothetical protein
VKCVAFFALGSVVTGIASFVAFDGVLADKPVQGAVVAEFVARYCHPDPKLPETFRMGDAAALSRVAIKSGLQPMAWTEYLKCKSGI